MELPGCEKWNWNARRVEIDSIRIDKRIESYNLSSCWSLPAAPQKNCPKKAMKAFTAFYLLLFLFLLRSTHALCNPASIFSYSFHSSFSFESDSLLTSFDILIFIIFDSTVVASIVLPSANKLFNDLRYLASHSLRLYTFSHVIAYDRIFIST